MRWGKYINWRTIKSGEMRDEGGPEMGKTCAYKEQQADGGVEAGVEAERSRRRRRSVMGEQGGRRVRAAG